MADILGGFRDPALQSALTSHQGFKMNVPGQMPAVSTYIPREMITQPTQGPLPQASKNLPLSQLGLGIPDASGDPLPQAGRLSGGPGAAATPLRDDTVQKAQLDAIKKQQDVQQATSALGGATTGAMLGAKYGTALIPIPGVGTALGAVLGGIAGWVLGG